MSHQISVQEYSAREKQILADLQALIEKAQVIFYTDPIKGNLNQERETLGTLVSKFCKWSSDDILTVAHAALIDANADEDADKIQSILDGI